MELEVMTYGGIDILDKIFNGVAMLFNGQSGGMIRPVAVITASIGAVFAAGRVFFSGSASAFMGGYLLPLVGIGSAMMVPTADIHLHDLITHEQRLVSHVPLFLARFAELTSTVGYQLTRAMEGVLHVPSDQSYADSGMIFASDTALSSNRCVINDPILDGNLRHFSKQCLLYDVALGQYSLDDLKKTCDLWKFLSKRTSKVRMMPYTGSGASSSEEYVSCKEAMEKMEDSYSRQQTYYMSQAMTKNLDLSFQALTKIVRDRRELIGQQLMMTLLHDEFDGHRFAAERAHEQQKSTYLILGALASRSLVTMRLVIEALVYAAFIFVIPMALLPGGVRVIGNWMWLVTWIQLWPPFYCILNYIMMTYAHSESAGIFSALGDNQMGLSFYTRAGLRDLHEDVYALSGYLSASIPFLSYSILQGGVGSFIHMAGSMMTPAHNAASSAAGELATGNLSYGNASLDSSSYGSQSMMQRNLAPSLRAGYSEFAQEDGSVRSGDKSVYLWENSRMSTDLSLDKSVGNSISHTKQELQSDMESKSKTCSKSYQAAGREVGDFLGSLSKGESAQESSNYREGLDARNAASAMVNATADWCKSENIGSNLVAEISGGAVLGKSMMGVGAEGRLGGRVDGSRNFMSKEAMSFSKSNQFQEAYENNRGFFDSIVNSHSEDSSYRGSDSLSASLDTLRSDVDSYQESSSRMQQFSESSSRIENSLLNDKKALGQRFADYVTQETSSIDEAKSLLFGREGHERLDALVEGFSNTIQREAGIKGSEEFGSADQEIKPLGCPSVQEAHHKNMGRVLEERRDHELDGRHMKSMKAQLNGDRGDQESLVQGNKGALVDGLFSNGSEFSSELEGDLSMYPPQYAYHHSVAGQSENVDPSMYFLNDARESKMDSRTGAMRQVAPPMVWNTRQGEKGFGEVNKNA